MKNVINVVLFYKRMKETNKKNCTIYLIKKKESMVKAINLTHIFLLKTFY